jgi:hypothetical protein
LCISANSAARNMASWCNSAKLIVNATKTTFLQFHTAQRHISSSPLIKLFGNSLRESTETKFLGITLSNTLDWGTHTENVAKKLTAASFLLRNLQFETSLEVRKLAYYALFQSHLSYGIEFWGCSPNISRLIVLQKRAIRALVGARCRSSCRPIFKKLGILTLPSLYIYCLVKFTRAHFDEFVTNGQVHTHDTRRKHDIQAQKHNLSLFARSPAYAGAALYNKLPQNIKSVTVSAAFNKKVKTFLIERCYYSVSEYLV